MIDETFYNNVNELLYDGEDGINYLKRISTIHSEMGPTWNGFCSKYFEVRYGEKPAYIHEFNIDNAPQVIRECSEIINELSNKKWKNDDIREEMILCTEGICVMAQLASKLYGKSYETRVDAKDWIRRYREMWLKKNKESEISKIEEMILYIENMGE